MLIKIILALSLIEILLGKAKADQHVLIGNYSTLNTINCGQNRYTYSDPGCFKYHEHDVPGLINARNVTAGDAPWVVLLISTNKLIKDEQFGCTGTLIADKWVLTTAACLKDNHYVQVYTGYDFKFLDFKDKTRKYYDVESVYKHPDFNEPTGLESRYDDIGLVELKQPIDSSTNALIENSICLPEEYIHNEKYEWARMAGWGGITALDLPVQIGQRIMEPMTVNENISDTLLFHKAVGNQSFACQGEGEPLWQFYQGRAVLIGINYLDIGDCTGRDATSIAVRVSYYIDWISNITGLY